MCVTQGMLDQDDTYCFAKGKILSAAKFNLALTFTLHYYHFLCCDGNEKKHQFYLVGFASGDSLRVELDAELIVEDGSNSKLGFGPKL